MSSDKERTLSVPGTEGEKHTLQTADSKPSVARSTLLMTAGTLLSRVTGLARTWVMAYVLGAGLLASSYQVANNLPNIIYETIAGGMIAAAFLPVLMLVAEKNGKDGENRYASNIINIVAVLLGAVSLLGIAFAEPLIATQTFTVDSSDEVVSNAVWLFRIFSVQVLFYGLSSIVQGMLNANRTFFVTAIAPAMNNVVVIASFVAYALISPTDPHAALLVLALGTTSGVVAQFAVQIPAIKKQGFEWSPVLDLRDSALKETVKIAVPTMVFVLASIVGQSVRNAFSLGASPSGPAMVAYAWMWFQLPYGVVAVSLSRALFTEMSDAAAKGDSRTLASLVSSGLRQTLCLMIPCTFCLIGLAVPIVGLFQSGAFTAEDTVQVAGMLSIWAVGLPAFSIWSYLYNAFAAVRSFMPFAVLNVILIAGQIPVYWAFSSTIGLYGIPLADVFYYMAYAAGSIVLVKRVLSRFDSEQNRKDSTLPADRSLLNVQNTVRLGGRSIAKDAAKAAGAGLVGLAVICASLLGLDVLVGPSTGTFSSLLKLTVGGVLGLSSMLGISYALGIEAIVELVQAMGGRLFKRSRG